MMMILNLAIAAGLCFVAPCIGRQPVAAPAAPSSTSSVAPDLLRSREVTIDSSVFAAQVGDRLDFTLFDDLTLSILIDRVIIRDDGLTLHAKILGEALGTCTITIQSGTFAAGFWSEHGSFSIIPTADGRSRAEQLHPQATARCLMGGPASYHPAHASPNSTHPARPAYPTLNQGLPTAPPHAAGPTHAPSPPPPSPLGGACSCPDDQSIVDVLCVYTSLARTSSGGLPALTARLQNAIDATNGAYTNSGLNSGGVNRLQIRLAGMVEIAYAEQSPPPPNWLNHLQRVTDPSDGYMDNVQSLRDQYKADTVLLVIDDPAFTGGTAWWALWDQAQAYSCINWRGLGGGNLTLAHELGHNFGCAHDHESDSSAPLSYAWGHYFTSGGNTYGTIMAYPGNIRLQQFSNPHQIHPGTGQPLGVVPGDPRAAYDALVISQTRWTLANYRDATGIVDCNADGLDDAADIAAGRSLDLNNNCRPDECEQIRYADAAVPGPGEGVSWSTSGGDLAELVAIANLGCNNIREIWTADGSYTPDSGTGERYRAFNLRTGLTLRGGFQGRSAPGGGETSLAQRLSGFTSILSGEIGNTASLLDNTYSVVFAIAADSTAALDTFTIEKAYSEFSGGGIYIDGANPTITNCTFRNNRASTGGGLAAYNAGGATLTNCSFQNNTATYGGGAAAVYTGGTLIADTTTFTNNTAGWGAGIASDDSVITLRSCWFTGGNAVTFNGGALDHNNVQLTAINTVFANNQSAEDGGALWLANATNASIINCTIYGNAATTDTGGAVVYFSTANITNSLLWANTGSSELVQDKNFYAYGDPALVRYSRVQGWDGSLGGPGNSGGDPLLANPATGDFSPLSGSTCIDAGDSPALPASFTLDAAARPRRTDDPATPNTGIGSAPIVDIGALEWQEPTPCPADFDSDGTVDFFDYDAFVICFEGGPCPPNKTADFDGDGSADFFDYDAFVVAFEAGC